MKMTAQDLAELGVIDRIVPEPVGGAQRDRVAAAEALAVAIDEELDRLSGKSPKVLRRMREDRFLSSGQKKTRRQRRAGT
jgi:acetyl-CoA carboxylase carboxyl transferase subunit alpha